jgi:hypothetical protein
MAAPGAVVRIAVEGAPARKMRELERASAAE